MVEQYGTEMMDISDPLVREDALRDKESPKRRKSGRRVISSGTSWEDDKSDLYRDEPDPYWDEADAYDR